VRDRMIIAIAVVAAFVSLVATVANILITIDIQRKSRRG